MGFGKRKIPPSGARATGAEATALAGAVPESSVEQRVGALLHSLLRCLTQSAELAGAISRMEMLDADRFGPQYRTQQYPIDIVDFADHFAFGAAGKPMHSVFAYMYPPAMGSFDNSAQVALLDLTTAVLHVNSLCFEGHRDGALGVAVQSPAMREAVDGVIVRAAFFVAFFENLLASLPHYTGTPEQRAKPFDLEAMRRVLDGRLEIARGAMLDPTRLDALLPNSRWPHLGVELGMPDHAGQQIVNEVYLPKDLAEPVMAKLAEAHALAASVEAG